MTMQPSQSESGYVCTTIEEAVQFGTRMIKRTIARCGDGHYNKTRRRAGKSPNKSEQSVAKMNSLLLGNPATGAHGILLHRLPAPPSGCLCDLPRPRARRSARSHLLSFKLNLSCFKSSCSRLSPPAPSSSIFSSPIASASVAVSAFASSAASIAAAAAGAISSFVPIRNGFLSWYLRMIEAHPLTTKSLTAAFIFATADVSSQIITTACTVSLDTVRILRMSGYGLLVLGPSLHFWYNFLSNILPKQDIITILKKILLGQTTFGPIMTAVFFSVNAFLQGESGNEIFSRLNRDLIPTIKAGFLYWPLCDFITFKFASVQLQPLVCNSFSFFWTIYLTQKASLEKVSDQENSTS
ncbi:uncharacterized protein LOC122019478 [Zingiber officinale]|uniref:uncharacterized protein LOC122019478 n=1 Tax=Zingiber officinale TaxID=94328 RepID=UPI001C4B2571|nr:uncharacterized protein LOC122019478 [Zingiber officinale]